MVRADQRIQVSDHEFLAGWNIVAQQVLDDAIHHLGMKHIADQRQQQQQKWKETENGVSGNRERKRVHLGPEQITGGGTQDAFSWRGAKFRCALLVGKLDRSKRRHGFSNIIKYLRLSVVRRRLHSNRKVSLELGSCCFSAT